MTFRTLLLAGTVMGVAAIASGAAQAETAAEKSKKAAPAAAAPAPAAPAYHPPAPAAAAPAVTAAQVDALTKQIQALQGQLDTLKEKVGKDIAAVDKKVADAPVVSVANGKPTITSADKNFTFGLTSRVHLDYGYNFPSKGFAGTDLPDGFNFRRVFLGVNGTVFKDWSYDVTMDFSGRTNSSGRLQNFQLSYNGFKHWAVDVGAFQPSFTFMDSTSSNVVPFLERSQTTNMAVANVANEARVAAGFRHWGDRYRVSVYMTGNQINQSNNDDQGSVIARASVLAATGTDYDVHVGGDFGYLYNPGQTNGTAVRAYSLSERPENRIGGGTVLINTGSIDTKSFQTYGGEFAASFQSLWTSAEYFKYKFERYNSTHTASLPDADFDSWYVAAGWFITGERRPYSVASGAFGAPRVQWPFKVSDGYGSGAFELVARYSVGNLNSNERSTAPGVAIRGGEQKITTLGVNWYANAAVRVMLNYQFIDVTTPQAVGADVNKRVDALAMRLQFAF